MTQDIANRDFCNILDQLKRKYCIVHCKWNHNRIFEVKFRTKIQVLNEDYNTYCDEWVDLFSKATDTTWMHTVSNTGPKVKFRKQYQCWTHKDLKLNKDMLFDSRKCRATVDLKILSNNLISDRQYGPKIPNKFERMGLNSLVKISFQHLHDVDITKPCAFFVHSCKPLMDPPQIAVPSSDKITQLVAKVIESAPVTAHKVAERAKAVLKRQCLSPGVIPHQYADDILETNTESSNSVRRCPVLKRQCLSPGVMPHQYADDILETNTVPSNSGNNGIHYPQLQLEGLLGTSQKIVSEKNLYSHPDASEEVIGENVYYIEHVVFDSETQTIKHSSVSGNNASNIL